MGGKRVSEGIIDIPIREAGGFGSAPLVERICGAFGQLCCPIILWEFDRFPKWVDWRLHNAASSAALIRQQRYVSQSWDVLDCLGRVRLA